MDSKPFDRFNDKPPRREQRKGGFGHFDRRDDRFSDKPRRFSEESRFEDRGPREDRFGDRPRRFEDRHSRFDGGSESRRYEDRGSRFNRPARRDFGTQSGPRAHAFEKRRHTDYAAFVKTATVRLDPDVAEAFHSSEAVNAALRALIAAAAQITPKTEAAEEKKVEETSEAASDEVSEEAEPLEEATEEKSES